MIRLVTVTLVTYGWRVFLQILKGETSRVILGVMWNSASDNDLTCDSHWCQPCVMCSTYNMSNVHLIAPTCTMDYAAHRVSKLHWSDLWQPTLSHMAHMTHMTYMSVAVCTDLKGETSRVILGVMWNWTSDNDLTCDSHYCQPCVMCSTHNMNNAHSIAPICAMDYLSLIHIWRCRRSTLCRSRWSPYH